MTDDACSWRQVNITFLEWRRAEQVALAHLAPMLCAAEDDGMLNSWFFIRKRPRWRVRYLPAANAETQVRIEQRLDELATERHIDCWARVVYEPEAHAFGGAEGMAAAHRLFHHDSRGLLGYLNRGSSTGHRRELSVMLCSILMRSAGQDWYEQGDIWARIAEHRAPTTPAPGGSVAATLPAAVSRLMTVDAESQMRRGAPLAYASEWAAAYSTAGRELADLAAAGALHRGLRDILAHHVIFAWNRLGLPYAAQSLLASTARSVVFGPDPTRQAEEGASWTAR